jgi:cyclic beta-1,2-glucan synthetase
MLNTGNDAWLNRREGIFVLRASQMPEADRVLLDTVAGVVLDERRGSLAEQLQHGREQPPRLPPFILTPPHRDAAPTTPVARPANLLFDNGLGGFSPDGKEYQIYLEPGQFTPQPWINVIANPQFGFLVSESGSGSTWRINSGENRLTPWRNDPVTDAPGEALYLRDEETTHIWSPTPAPIPANAPYLIRHGAGYTIFEHASHGLRQEMRVFAVQDAPVKIVWLRLEDTWQYPRRVTATYYAEWVLGTLRENAQLYVIPEFDAQSNALLARNPYNVEFGEQVAFLVATKPPHGLTTDRGEFLGRMGSLGDPAALRRIGLAELVQAGADPCAAIQVHFDLAPGGVEEIVFLLGAGANRQEALDLIARYQAPSAVEAAWRALGSFWDETLGAITVQTPDPAMNLLLNRWLLYQALSCRLWARSALYQSTGAYGFRDQLQDVLALFYTAPALAREHILRAASHQFEAGDVLHWWHPPSGRGVRTRIADDPIWLPFVTAQYVNVTGDQSILNEQVPFLKGDLLRDDEEERYGYYETTAAPYSLYEHCQRALKKGLTAGPHGLPLMGTGDWNDGMNRVGAGGTGESVWLGWFLYASLIRFAALCEKTGDQQLAGTYRQQAEQIRKAAEASGWDGRWYRRAYFDDGEPLGSSRNRECTIDSIAQSWAVLSRGANLARAAQAMESVAEHLVRPDAGIIRLLTPPFNKMPRDPGYIKGYLPGIRENGGQYTHAALWVAWAFAELGHADQATSLFKLLNPIYHSNSPEKVERYKVEPYVIAADVYDADGHRGHGGWTWYTGSASWMYRLGLEVILGLRQSGSILRFVPHIASDWPGYQVTYRYGDTLYHIEVYNPEGVYSGVKSVTLDGEQQPGSEIQLVQDGGKHEIRIELGFLGPKGDL